MLIGLFGLPVALAIGAAAVGVLLFRIHPMEALGILLYFGALALVGWGLMAVFIGLSLLWSRLRARR